MTKYIDAHCHLSDDALPTGGDVVQWICNGAAESDWATLLQRAMADARVAPCFGIHPWYAAAAAPDWDSRLRELLIAHPRAMIGECGLDKATQGWTAQRAVFQRHLEIASELQCTVQIHCVRAWDEVLGALRTDHVPRIIAHAFYGTPAIVRALSGLTDAYFSYSDMILRNPTPRLMECIATTPVNRILVESDRAPQESVELLPKIIAAIAKIKSIDNNDMRDIIYNNSMRVINDG